MMRTELMLNDCEMQHNAVPPGWIYGTVKDKAGSVQVNYEQ